MRCDEAQVPQISNRSMNASVASLTFAVPLSRARPYPENVVSSYQMNSSCRFNDHTDSPRVPANHTALSREELSHLPPTDHCAMPRPGPPPYCTAFGLTPDSWSRFPTMPAA